MDPLSHRLAVRLADVPDRDLASTTAVEVGPDGARIAVEGGPLALAVAGPGAMLAVGGASVRVPAVVRIEDGQEVVVSGGARWTTLCPVDGTLRAPAVLGSTSRHGRTALGPAWPVDACVDVTDPAEDTGRRESSVLLGERTPPATTAGPLLLLPAPQTHLFAADVRERLTGRGITIGSAGDRMAQRLEGVRLETEAGGHDVVSDAVVAGAIQVQGDGAPWVLGAEHQPTGGYPKVAVLATADRGRFVQRPPGSDVRFRWGDVTEARARWRTALAAIEQVAVSSPTPSSDRLQRAEVAGVAGDGLTDDTVDTRRR